MRLRAFIFAVLLAMTGLAASSPPSSAATANTDWYAYHANRFRTGYDAQMPAYRGGLHVVKRIALDGAVYGSPIVAKGVTVVATENDTVYAFGAGNGLLWKRHLGTPVPRSALPCGDIDPLGITGTPVYWGTANVVFVAAEFANPVRHRLFALRLSNGTIASNRSLDFSGVQTAAMQQRGALTITGGRVWTPFGGLAGDCSNYKGRVVGYPLTGAGAAVRYTVPTQREAGIWTPPGPTVTGSGSLLVAVGNGAAGSNGLPYDYSDSVLKLSTAATRVQSFSPSSWRTDNDNDLDLGSQGPAVVQNKWVFQAGKSGTAYVLSLARLGGIGGQVSQASLCRSFGGTSVFKNFVFVPCTDGVRAVSINSTGQMRVLWHAASSVTGAPVISPGMIWTLDTGAGVLHGIGVWSGRNVVSLSVGSVTRFATPALSGRRILIGTTSGLTIASF